MQNRKTKIVCSLGPASSTDEVVRNLILSGMNVARFNFSHGTHESHRTAIEQVRRISAELKIPVALMLDTKGPEIRTGMVESGGDNNEGTKEVTINKNDAVDVKIDDSLTSAVSGQKPAVISISWKEAPAKLKAGHHILIADGLLDLEVLGVEGAVVKCRANNAASIGSKKNVNLSGVHAGLPIMAEQDKKDLAFGAEMDLDLVAASFLSFPHEVIEIKKYMETVNGHMKVIAKIESQEGLENIKEIAQLADGVMVARGDLGVQLPTEQIPLAQKHIINVCRRMGKPVITATQMLDSMIVNPRPTRAELTDVANAIFDGTDAVMLSGETANGAYPVEAVQTMNKIALTIEDSAEFKTRMRSLHNQFLLEDPNPGENLGVIMSRAGVETAEAVSAKAIMTPTLSGNTARLLSAFRPEEPVIAVTPNEQTQRALQLYWGVQAYIAPIANKTESMIQRTIQIASEMGVAELSDKIVLVAGLPLHGPNSVNTVRVLILGTILARASMGGYANPKITRLQGKLVHTTSANDARDKLNLLGGDILICRMLNKDYAPILQKVKGVICEDVSEFSDEELKAINPDLVWLNHIRRSVDKLESGLSVTIDATQMLVYEGAV